MRSSKYKVHFESLGVRFAVHANVPDAAHHVSENLEKILPGYNTVSESDRADHTFDLIWGKDGLDTLYRDKKLSAAGAPRGEIMDLLTSFVRMTVAEYAPDHIFIHAGTVLWRGRAILIPGRSFMGKSRLTSELVRAGAEYFSDEYAILDSRGNVLPFPKDLSLRSGDSAVQTDHSVAEFGRGSTVAHARAALVLFTKFRKNARWRPERLSTASGVLRLIDATVPIQRNPVLALDVMKAMSGDAAFFTTNRGDAEKTAVKVLELFDSLAKQ